MFSSAFKNFWHAMTSNDRHSNYNSPYRTGQHVPLNPENGRMTGLTSVATASESRQDVSSPYSDYSVNPLDRVLSPTARPGASSPRIPQNPGSQAPYSPGSRSESARRQSQMGNGFGVQSPSGEIPMQSFQDGLPPPPPVSNSWHRIDNWAEENYPELLDQLCEGCTNNDLNELEHMLDCSLPNDVRESLQIHDGQERGGLPTGIIFSCMLLDCEEIVQEWDNWRRVNTEYLSAAAEAAEAAARRAAAAASAAAAAADAAAKSMADPVGNGSAAGSARSSVDGHGEASSSRSAPSVAGSSSNSNGNPMWRQELLARQECVPPGAIQKAYAHPAWIPLVRDWGGNNLAIDLAPGPRGQWGQIIMFGRDYDTKYVVARSWAAFLALVADDMSSGKWYIDEDSKELKLREFKSARVEPPYFDILRWRMDQKYGRRVNKRKSVVPGTNGSPTNTGSPYVSPTEPAASDRGRPLQRLSLNTPLVSPNRPSIGANKLSPLARVTEETSLPELNMVLPDNEEAETLVEVETPRAPTKSTPQQAPVLAPPKTATATINETTASAGTESVADGGNSETAPAATSASRRVTMESEADDAMKTIEI